MPSTLCGIVHKEKKITEIIISYTHKYELYALYDQKKLFSYLESLIKSSHKLYEL